MKILHLISSNGFYGAENVVIELSKKLNETEFNPYIGIITSNPCQNESFTKAAGKFNLKFLVFNCRGKFDPKTILEVRKFIRKNGIDIVHSHGYKSNFYCFLSTFGIRVKKISTCHNWLSTNKKMRFYENLDKWALKKFDSVISVSDSLREEIIESGLRRELVTTIYNGIDITHFDCMHKNNELKKSLGIDITQKVIGTVGRLTLEKGHIFLVKAFAKVVPELPNTILLIIGDGPLRKELENAVDTLGLKGKVKFLGIRNDIPNLLGIMDVFVLPSLDEGMPMALLEAMAMKKPVVASRTGAIAKVIEDKVTGLLVEPAEVESLHKSIIYVLKDTKISSVLSEKAYEKVKNEFSSTKMAQSYISLYQKYCKERGLSSPKNRKIIMVEIAGKGGICHYTYNLSQELSRYNKVVLVTGANYELIHKKKNFKLIGIFNRFNTGPLFIVSLANIFRDRAVEIIHFQLSQYPAFVLALVFLAKLMGKRIVITSHNVESHEKKVWEKSIYKCLYLLVDKIIVHSYSNCLDITHKFKIDAQKISTIPHGNYLFFNEEKLPPPVPQDRFNILFFGYIRRYKGLIYLIKSLSLIKQRIPQVKLLIVGTPTQDFDDYQKEIKDLSLQDNVEINLGYLPFEQVKNYFFCANVIVLPYIEASQSGIAQLAYGLGRPVVATSVGGLQEVVEDGKSGFIVPPKDINALAEKIITILSDHKLQQRMGD
ncbi:MAG: glycosyltransferase, partial [Candidatus Omnitrophica bacterium]|nr:glycosyltransferase [Candidatus Omnitrophota bacterium]